MDVGECNQQKFNQTKKEKVFISNDSIVTTSILFLPVSISILSPIDCHSCRFGANYIPAFSNMLLFPPSFASTNMLLFLHNPLYIATTISPNSIGAFGNTRITGCDSTIIWKKWFGLEGDEVEFIIMVDVSSTSFRRRKRGKAPFNYLTALNIWIEYTIM